MGSPEIIKTRTTTFKITHIALDMLVFDQRFREIRGNYRYKGFECYSCGKHFQDGEIISVAFTSKGNKTVCHECGINFEIQLKEAQ